MEIFGHYGISKRIDEMIINLKELDDALRKGQKQAELCKVGWVSPLSILPLAVFANKHQIKIACSEEDHNVLTYLEIIGFPQGIKDFTKSDKRYLPITQLPCSIESELLRKYEERIMENIDEKYRSSFLNALTYLTCELEDNVREHARIDHYWLLAQYWNNNKTCEITLADTGIGYRESYRGTTYEVETDLEAINNALEGKSSKKLNERGAGIPRIINMFINGYGGKVVIMSGESLLYYGKEKIKTYDLDFKWSGVFVGINFALREIKIEDYY
jgi:hypothetical protein